MASLADCTAALVTLGQQLAQARADGHGGDIPDRRLALRLPDLGQTLRADLRGGALEPARGEQSDDPPADITVTCDSDLLLTVCSGELSFARAWASGRLKVDAGLRDLVRVRSWF